MLLEVNANNMYPHRCEMHWCACQLMFVFRLSQKLSVQCSIFIFSYPSEIFESFPAFILGRYKETLTRIIFLIFFYFYRNIHYESVNSMKVVNTNLKLPSLCSFPTHKA